MALKDNNKTLIVDVFDAELKKDGKTVFYSKNLTSTNLSNEIEQEEVRNGKGNALFAVLNKNKSAKITLGTNVFSFATICMTSGAEIVTGAGVGYAPIKEYTLASDKSIALEHKPLDSTALQFINTKTGEEVTGVYAQEGDKVTFDALSEGDLVRCMTYKFESPDNSSVITVNAEDYATGGELILTTYERNADNKIIADIAIVCQRVIPDGNWELNTQSEVQPTDLEITLNVMKDEEGNLYKIIRTPRA